MRVIITTTSRTLTIVSDESISEVVINHKKEFVTEESATVGQIPEITFEQQSPQQLEEVVNTLNHMTGGMPERMRMYMSLEELLLRCGSEIPFIKGLITGEICDRVLSNTTPVVKGRVKKYYWDVSRTCGFKFDELKGEWSYFLPVNVRPFPPLWIIPPRSVRHTWSTSTKPPYLE